MALTWQGSDLASGRPFRRALVAAVAVTALLSGCAAPGVPVTRGTTKPQRITDLSAQQVGNSVVLSFTLPTETTKGSALSGAPEIQIYRTFINGLAAANGSRLPKLKRIETISSQTVRQNTEAGKVRLTDVLTEKEFAAHAGKDELFYAIRAHIERSSSDSSNISSLPILPVPQAVSDLRAQVANNPVELTWTAPAILPQGSTAPSSMKYQVFRADIQPASQSANTAPQTEFSLLGESPEPNYADKSAQSGQSYRYMVRTIAEYSTGSVQSVDSNAINVAVAPNSRPAAPTNVIATLAPANSITGPYIELSWAIGSEPGVTGYNVYRSTALDTVGTRVNTAPVLTPVFEDQAVSPGATYFYRVTAVNGTGNESDYSAPVEIAVPSS